MKISLLTKEVDECQLILSFKGVKKKPPQENLDYHKLYTERFFNQAAPDNGDYFKHMTEKGKMVDFLKQRHMHFEGRFFSDSKKHLGRGKLIVKGFFSVRYILRELHEYKYISSQTYGRFKQELEAFNQEKQIDIETCCFCLPI